MRKNSRALMCCVQNKSAFFEAEIIGNFYLPSLIIDKGPEYTGFLLRRIFRILGIEEGIKKSSFPRNCLKTELLITFLLPFLHHNVEFFIRIKHPYSNQ